MIGDLRLPENRGESIPEQLRQIRSYLYQLSEQLQIALEQPRQETGTQTREALTPAAKSD